MIFHLLVLTLIGNCLAEDTPVKSGAHLTTNIHCKYLTIKENTSHSDSLDSLLSFKNYRIRFKPIVAIHQNFSDIPPDSIILGLDLSHNHLTDQDLSTLIAANPSLFQQIKVLDLSGNRLTTWEANRQSDKIVFQSLQVLILDSNSYLKKLSLNHINLKVLSLRRCNLALITSFQSSNLTNMVYMGLADNKITDISNSINVYNLINKLIPSQVRILDLSANKLTRLETIKYLLQTVRLQQVNLESNLISQFNAGNLAPQSNVEINLRFNFIRNTSRDLYLSPNLTIELDGNPLFCDCSSMWLLKETKKLLPVSMVFKRRKLAYHDPIKLIYKRETERISPHYSFSDDESSSLAVYLERQKRLRLTHEVVTIKDLSKLKCSFIDVQERASPDPVSRHHLLSTELQKQNFYVNEIKYREKLIADSEYEDYMCAYEDHCVQSECNCCVFKHCYCRSICPRQCRCYFDTDLKHNVIDCSSQGLTEVPGDKPESATDMRLNANSFKFLKSHAFFGFAQLRFLYLQDNQISYIASDSFEDLKSSVQLINLAGNRLEFLSGSEFNGLESLEVLILNENPLKSIENVHFIDSSNLPSLKQLYVYRTRLLTEQNSEFLEYSLNHPNASILFETTTTAATTKTTIPITTITASITSTTTTTLLPEPKLQPQLETQLTNRSQLVSKFFNRFTLFNWQYFPALVFLSCLCLSFIIVLTVIAVARRVETNTTQSKIIGIIDVGGGAFLATNYSSNLKTVESDNDYDDEDGDENSSARLMMVDKFCTCISKNRSSLDSSCDEIYETNRSKLNYDSATVAVSRSVANLSLHVYVYYSLADADYVGESLQAVLSRCVTFVPDTKYFYKPQTDKYVKLSPESFYDLARQTNCSTLVSSTVLDTSGSVLLTDSNSTSVDSSNSGELLLTERSKPNGQVNIIVANVLVVSESFHGYTPTDSYVSIKTKNKHKDVNSVDGSTSSKLENKPHMLLNAETNIRSSFRIYLHPPKASPATNFVTLNDHSQFFSSSKTHSLNQKLMKRLLKEPADNSKEACRLTSKCDLFSSDAFSESLQFKLEKYLQGVCLRSRKFSKNNFSYVDYTKR